MDFNTLVAKADEAIARSNVIIQQAIADNIISRATSIEELSRQARVDQYFRTNNII